MSWWAISTSSPRTIARNARAIGQWNVLDASADDAAFALSAMGDRFDRFSGATTQRMHTHDIAAPHMREERADRDLLRRQRHIDRAAFHQLRVCGPIDECHDLVTAQAFREHRRQDVRFFRIRDGTEDIRAVDVLLEQQLLVCCISVEHDRVAQLLGDAPRATWIALDELDLMFFFEPTREAKTDVAAARNDDAARGVLETLHLVHHEAYVLARGDEEHFIAVLDRGCPSGMTLCPPR